MLCVNHGIELGPPRLQNVLIENYYRLFYIKYIFVDCRLTTTKSIFLLYRSVINSNNTVLKLIKK